jgi:NCS1 family nucleobase:cation symporter-1
MSVLMSDFWLVRKGKGFNVYQLYQPGGIYWFTAGWNFRAIAAFISGVVPLLPGLIFNINPGIKGISQGILDFYTLAWLNGAFVSG